MKKTSLIGLFLMCLLALCSWGFQPENPLRKGAWLIGTWENKTSRGSLYETWTKVSEDELAGKSYTLREHDTTIFETIRLLHEQGSLYYIPTVPNQNEGLPVRFALKTISDTAMVFENPEHDFPQVISYTKTSPDALLAEISGTKNGQVRKQTFPMKRVDD